MSKMEEFVRETKKISIRGNHGKKVMKFIDFNLNNQSLFDEDMNSLIRLIKKTAKDIYSTYYCLNLDLSENHISCEGLRHILTFILDRNDYLVINILKLYKNNIKDEGASMICELIMKQKKPIEELHLSHNSIHDNTCRELLRSFVNAKHENGYVYPRHDKYQSTFKQQHSQNLVPVWIRLEYNCIRNPKELVKEVEEYARKQRGSKNPLIVCSALKGDRRCSPFKCLNASGSFTPIMHVYMFIHQKEGISNDHAREERREITETQPHPIQNHKEKEKNTSTIPTNTTTSTNNNEGKKKELINGTIVNTSSSTNHINHGKNLNDMKGKSKQDHHNNNNPPSHNKINKEESRRRGKKKDERVERNVATTTTTTTINSTERDEPCTEKKENKSSGSGTIENESQNKGSKEEGKPDIENEKNMTRHEMSEKNKEEKKNTKDKREGEDKGGCSSSGSSGCKENSTEFFDEHLKNVQMDRKNGNEDPFPMYIILDCSAVLEMVDFFKDEVMVPFSFPGLLNLHNTVESVKKEKIMKEEPENTKRKYKDVICLMCSHVANELKQRCEGERMKQKIMTLKKNILDKLADTGVIEYLSVPKNFKDRKHSLINAVFLSEEQIKVATSFYEISMETIHMIEFSILWSSYIFHLGNQENNNENNKKETIEPNGEETKKVIFPGVLYFTAISKVYAFFEYLFTQPSEFMILPLCVSVQRLNKYIQDEHTHIVELLLSKGRKVGINKNVSEYEFSKEFFCQYIRKHCSEYATYFPRSNNGNSLFSLGLSIQEDAEKKEEWTKEETEKENPKEQNHQTCNNNNSNNTVKESMDKKESKGTTTENQGEGMIDYIMNPPMLKYPIGLDVPTEAGINNLHPMNPSYYFNEKRLENASFVSTNKEEISKLVGKTSTYSQTPVCINQETTSSSIGNVTNPFQLPLDHSLMNSKYNLDPNGFKSMNENRGMEGSVGLGRNSEKLSSRDLGIFEKEDSYFSNLNVHGNNEEYIKNKLQENNRSTNLLDVKNLCGIPYSKIVESYVSKGIEEMGLHNILLHPFSQMLPMNEMDTQLRTDKEREILKNIEPRNTYPSVENTLSSNKHLDLDRCSRFINQTTFEPNGKERENVMIKEMKGTTTPNTLFTGALNGNTVMSTRGGSGSQDSLDQNKNFIKESLKELDTDHVRRIQEMERTTNHGGNPLRKEIGIDASIPRTQNFKEVEEPMKLSDMNLYTDNQMRMKLEEELFRNKIDLNDLGAGMFHDRVSDKNVISFLKMTEGMSQDMSTQRERNECNNNVGNPMNGNNIKKNVVINKEGLYLQREHSEVEKELQGKERQSGKGVGVEPNVMMHQNLLGYHMYNILKMCKTFKSEISATATLLEELTLSEYFCKLMNINLQRKIIEQYNRLHAVLHSINENAKEFEEGLLRSPDILQNNNSSNKTNSSNTTNNNNIYLKYADFMRPTENFYKNVHLQMSKKNEEPTSPMKILSGLGHMESPLQIRNENEKREEGTTTLFSHRRIQQSDLQLLDRNTLPFKNDAMDSYVNDSTTNLSLINNNGHVNTRWFNDIIKSLTPLQRISLKEETSLQQSLQMHEKASDSGLCNAKKSDAIGMKETNRNSISACNNNSNHNNTIYSTTTNGIYTSEASDRMNNFLNISIANNNNIVKNGNNSTNNHSNNNNNSLPNHNTNVLNGIGSVHEYAYKLYAHENNNNNISKGLLLHRNNEMDGELEHLSGNGKNLGKDELHIDQRDMHKLMMHKMNQINMNSNMNGIEKSKHELFNGLSKIHMANMNYMNVGKK